MEGIAVADDAQLLGETLLLAREVAKKKGLDSGYARLSGVISPRG